MGERHSVSGPRHTGSPVADARKIGEAEERRRRRAGKPGGNLVWRGPPRNGLTFKPYTYRGLGYDTLTGDM